MSVNPLTLDTFTIKRIDPTPTQDDGGGYDEDASYDTTHRGALVTSATGRATLARPEEATSYGTRTTETLWVFRSKTDLAVDTRDLIRWTDEDSVVRNAKIVKKSQRISPASDIYRAYGIEYDANFS